MMTDLQKYFRFIKPPLSPYYRGIKWLNRIKKTHRSLTFSPVKRETQRGLEKGLFSFNNIFIFMVLLFGFLSVGYSQTTGKITGHITDKISGESLPGANILLDNTSFGAAADSDGRFSIINLPPGSYSVSVMMIGYKTIQMSDVLVSTNRTSSFAFKMEQTVIEGDVVQVVVDRIHTKKDQTGTIKNISGDDIENLVIENIGSVINMQAGVVNGHFRGGRNTEVAFLVDGVQVDESFGGVGSSVEIEPEAVQDLEVITGTFNAEYGRAMSGIVNVVTRSGGPVFKSSASISFGNYETNNTDIFIGLSPTEFDRNQDYKFQIEGPVLGDKLTFFANVRSQKVNGHLNGIRRFNVDDFSNFYANDPVDWYSEHSGDSSYVPMNRRSNFSFLGKLALKAFKGFRLSALYSFNDDNWFDYDHAFKYNPDGMAGAYRTTGFATLHLNHMLGKSLFYDLKYSNMNTYNGWYVFESPTDAQYVHDKYLDNYGPGFFTGGQQKGHSVRTHESDNIKFDMVWQANHRHSFKWGAQFLSHTIENEWHEIRNEFDGISAQDTSYSPVIFGDSTVYGDVYKVKPTESALYLQDKMEFDEMVINIGLRYDAFDPKTAYPSDNRNPANQLNLPDSMMSTFPDAPIITQISPRFGLAYQLGNQAVLHFSYGHFFQMPPMYALYQNHSRLVPPSDYSTTMGNPLLKPEKTITYEVGLWQELTRNAGMEVSLFYRDIYNLLSTKIISTYNQIEYGLYSNKDYGNARGLELKLDMSWGSISTNVNYTLQYTRGNADYPTQAFDRAGNSMDPVNRLIPMSWDQRHTLNGTVNYQFNGGGMTVTGFYNSGMPYTFSPLAESVLSRINLYPNNDGKPSAFSADFSLYKSFTIAGNYQAKFEVNIFNLFDRLNENWVNSQTGRAYTAVIQETDLAGHRSDFNDYDDRIQNPAMYSAPRYVKVSIGIKI